MRSAILPASGRAALAAPVSRCISMAHCTALTALANSTSTPSPFSTFDEAEDAAEKIVQADVVAVADQCWQCKLCYIKCPYTPDEGASELLDFPRLMARERAAGSIAGSVASVASTR